MNLELKNVRWGVKNKLILNDISLHVNQNEVVGILGPNGSGKSSLLKTVYKINKPTSGVVLLNGQDIWNMPSRDIAKVMAVMTQEYPIDFSFSVEEIVLLGRLPFKTGYSKHSKEDFMIMDSALDKVSSGNLRDRKFHTLSGGEKQRVLLARALVQEPRILLLDEPTNHLDIHFQLEILEIIKSLGITCLIAIHDLNLACRYCDRVYIMNKGVVVAAGIPKDICSVDVIKENYNVNPVISFNEEYDSMELQFYKSEKKQGF